MSQLQLRSNLFKLYLFSFFQCFLVVMPVLVPFWEDKGLSLKEIFLLQGVFGAALIAFDAPAGYLADIFGRRLSLIIGAVITSLAYQVFWYGTTFTDYVLFELIVGLGLSLQSGCDVALLYNSLDKIENTERRASYLGKRVTAQTLGEGSASLLGGYLASFSLNLPAQVNALTTLLPIVIAVSLKEVPGERLPTSSHTANFRMIAKTLFRQSRLLTLAFAGFILYGFATYCLAWSVQPYWKARGVEISNFGFLWALNCFLTAIFAKYAHEFERRIGSVTSILVIAILPVIGYFGMALAPGAWGLIFVWAFPMCRGLNQVLFIDAINTRVPAEIRSTTNSIASLGMRAMFLVFGPLIGHALDTRGPDYAFLILGTVFTVGFFAVACPLLTQRAHFRTSD